MMRILPLLALLGASVISPFCAGVERATAPLSLGRLFFTPAERAKLDDARRNPAVESAPIPTPIIKPIPPAPALKIITLNGMVKRSDGQSTVWINDQPISDSDDSAIAVKHRDTGGRLTIQVPKSRRSVHLKVGQSADVKTGEIRERYSNSDAAELLAPRTKSDAAGERTTERPRVNETDTARAKDADASRSDSEADSAR